MSPDYKNASYLCNPWAATWQPNLLPALPFEHMMLQVLLYSHVCFAIVQKVPKAAAAGAPHTSVRTRTPTRICLAQYQHAVEACHSL